MFFSCIRVTLRCKVTFKKSQTPVVGEFNLAGTGIVVRPSCFPGGCEMPWFCFARKWLELSELNATKLELPFGFNANAALITVRSKHVPKPPLKLSGTLPSYASAAYLPRNMQKGKTKAGKSTTSNVTRLLTCPDLTSASS